MESQALTVLIAWAIEVLAIGWYKFPFVLETLSVRPFDDIALIRCVDFAIDDKLAFLDQKIGHQETEANAVLCFNSLLRSAKDRSQRNLKNAGAAIPNGLGCTLKERVPVALHGVFEHVNQGSPCLKRNQSTLDSVAHHRVRADFVGRSISKWE